MKLIIIMLLIKPLIGKANRASEKKGTIFVVNYEVLRGLTFWRVFGKRAAANIGLAQAGVEVLITFRWKFERSCF